jgi:hypothetical protein
VGLRNAEVLDLEIGDVVHWNLEGHRNWTDLSLVCSSGWLVESEFGSHGELRSSRKFLDCPLQLLGRRDVLHCAPRKVYGHLKSHTRQIKQEGRVGGQECHLAVERGTGMLTTTFDPALPSVISARIIQSTSSL